MDVITICDFLKQAIEELKKIVPLEKHQWQGTSITRSESVATDPSTTRSENIAINPSKKPELTMSIFDVTKLSVDFRNSLWNSEQISHWRTIAKTNGKGFVGSLHPRSICENLLRDYCNQLTELSYHHDIALQTTQNLLNSLNTGHSAVIYYTVLRGLDGDFESHNFSDGIRIRRLTDTELSALLDLDNTLFEDEQVHYHPCLVEYSYDLPIIENHKFEDVTSRFNRIITALRLLKEGFVEYQDIRTRPAKPGQLFDWTNSKSRKWRMRLKSFPITTYELFTSDIPMLEMIVEGLGKATNDDRLQTAISRMNFASERERPEDQLVDLMVALEAIYGDNDEKSDISYKLRMRCAGFLSSEYSKRDELRDFISKAYGIRSTLVHGARKSKSKITPKDMNDMVNKLRDIVRQSITLMLKHMLDGESVVI